MDIRSAFEANCGSARFLSADHFDRVGSRYVEVTFATKRDAPFVVCSKLVPGIPEEENVKQIALAAADAASLT